MRINRPTDNGEEVGARCCVSQLSLRCSRSRLLHPTQQSEDVAEAGLVPQSSLGRPEMMPIQQRAAKGKQRKAK